MQLNDIQRPIRMLRQLAEEVDVLVVVGVQKSTPVEFVRERDQDVTV